ncbi:squalene synthase HpnC [bacterium]|nr:squalene synthase HpnC [bacterium]
MSVETAYKEALLFTKSHYENFPVVSLFLPKHLRKHVAVVYQFARQADDLADEGNINSELRTCLPAGKVENLELYKNHFTNCLNGKYESDFWYALGNTITEYKLTPKYFYDLISAFKQDLQKTRYQTFDELINYCERSANPVGRIILEFFSIHDAESLRFSDAVCTALQLTNFYQDVSVDIKKDRIYIPLEELQKFGVTENQFEFRENNTNFEQLVRYQVERTKLLFIEGRNLVSRLPKELGSQIYMTILGGEKILSKIEKTNYNVISVRPKLSKLDYLTIYLKTLV